MPESESRSAIPDQAAALRVPSALMPSALMSPAQSHRPRSLREKRIAEPGELDQLKDALRLAATPADPICITEDDRRISNED